MKIFKYRHFGIQGPVFRNIADFAECGDSVFGNVHAVDGCFAAVGRQIAGQQAHQRGFAGAVRAEQRDNLAFLMQKLTSSTAFISLKLLDRFLATIMVLVVSSNLCCRYTSKLIFKF